MSSIADVTRSGLSLSELVVTTFVLSNMRNLRATSELPALSSAVIITAYTPEKGNVGKTNTLVNYMIGLQNK